MAPMRNFDKLGIAHATFAMISPRVQKERACALLYHSCISRGRYCVDGGHVGEIVQEGHRNARQLPRNPRTAQAIQR
jgi:hypothetical protein